MNCKAKINRCLIIGENPFRAMVLNSVSILEGDSFRYEIKDGVNVILNQEIEPINQSVILEVPQFQNYKMGRIFSHRLYMTREGRTILIFTGEIKLTSEGCCDTTEGTFTISDEIIEINFTYTENPIIVNHYLGWEYLTDEQKAELRFDYEDFTPENIENLKQPATEAAQTAAIATENAVLAITAATEATTAANEAAETANSAAQTATSAAGSATAAAGSATAAAGEAEQKATLANNAASAANTAAELANNAKGWQPLLVVDTTTIAGKTLMKLADWTGGTGTKPTTNIGQWQKADGTYTAVASEAVILLSNVSEDFIWANKNITDFPLAGYYVNNGVFGPSAGYFATNLYRAKQGMQFKAMYVMPGNSSNIMFFRENKTMISFQNTAGTFTAPAETYYVGFSRNSANQTQPIYVQSDFWALQQDDFYTEFTFNSNPEKVISAVDINTDTITSIAHGLVNGDTICITKNHNLAENTNPVSLIPGGLAIACYYVINATADTFQLSLTSGGVAVNLTVNATMNLAKIHIEKLSTKVISVTGLPDFYGWRIISKLNMTAQNSSGIQIRGVNFVHAQRWLSTLNPTTLGFADVLAGLNSEHLNETIIKHINGRNVIMNRGISVNYTSATAMNVSRLDVNSLDSIYTSPSFINGIVISSTSATHFILNNSRVEVYKL